MAQRTYLRLPINADEGFPQSFRLNVGRNTYRLSFYVNALESDQPIPKDLYELPEQGAFLVMRVVREAAMPEVIFQRRLVRDLEYEAGELAFVFRRMLVARRNLNGIGAFGSDVVGGVAAR
jgi:hypothetical protein